MRVSRRHALARLGIGVVAHAAMPSFVMTIRAEVEGGHGPIRLDRNENAHGPSPKVIATIERAARLVNRYPEAEAELLRREIARLHGIQPDRIVLGSGAGEILRAAIHGLAGPGGTVAAAAPGYDVFQSMVIGAGCHLRSVRLNEEHSHDLAAMLAASDSTTRLVYICNPNNPTGTLTPAADIEWLVANKPAGCIVMIDEAYTHIAGAPFHTDMVAADKDVVILRTFSKIYGMAGLRAGAAIARPDLLKKLGGFSSGMMPITGMAAASASLEAKYVVPERRKLIGDVREDTYSFLEKHNFSYVPGKSNCFMVDVKRPVREVITAMQGEKVYVGRPWPVWPTHMRVTVGLADEMKKFQAALLKVMA